MNRKLLMCAMAASIAALTLNVATQAQAAVDKRVSIVNESGQNIISFRATHSYDRHWREDLLGDYVIHPGYHMVIDMEDGKNGCEYDFRTVLANGQRFFRYNVNVCLIGTYTITQD